MYTLGKGTLREVYSRIKSAGRLSEALETVESDIRDTWTDPAQVRTDIRVFLTTHYTYNRDDLELDDMIKAIQNGIDDAKKVLKIQ